MNASTTAPQAAPTEWTDFVFTQPALPLERQAEFFSSAPEGTLVEVNGDLYRLSPSGLWLALEETVLEGNFGSPYATHESYTAEFLVEYTATDRVPVRVLRLGR